MNLTIWRAKERIHYWRKRLDGQFNLFGCDWHISSCALSDEDYECGAVSCPDCGALLWTKLCYSCGKSFLDWNARGWDDICGAVSCTSSGDIVCARCAERYERDEEANYEDDSDCWGNEVESDIEL